MHLLQGHTTKAHRGRGQSPLIPFSIIHSDVNLGHIQQQTIHHKPAGIMKTIRHIQNHTPNIAINRDIMPNHRDVIQMDSDGVGPWIPRHFQGLRGNIRLNQQGGRLTQQGFQKNTGVFPMVHMDCKRDNPHHKKRHQVAEKRRTIRKKSPHHNP